MRQRLGDLFRFLLFLTVLTILAGLFSALSTGLSKKRTPDAPAQATVPTVVIDAGHGGEDGGAVSASGILEKDVNLAVAEELYVLLRENGINAVLTRSEDRMLYDRNADYKGRKKALDLAARKKIADETPESVFVSIHMNSFPNPKYSGFQVWYSPNHPDSEALAQSLQSAARERLQPDNHRLVKAATSSIFLLHNLRTPAVLVECGFLSNPAEAEKLNTPAYRRELAAVICEGILRHYRDN